MRFSGLIFLSGFALQGAPTIAQAADFTVEDWLLLTAVNNNSTGEFDLDGTNQVQNPLHTTFFASLPPSITETMVDISWSDSFGSFLIQAAHQAEHDGSLISATESRIFISPTIDLEVTVHAEYQYNLPAIFMGSELNVSFSDSKTFETIFFEELVDDTNLGPTSGTFTIDGSFTMPAGRTWLMFSLMETTSFSGSSANIATADGNIAITLQTVPEPATLSLLTIGSLLLLLHRRRHCAKPHPRPSC